MYIVYNLLFTITINIENYYYKTINTRWLYQIIRYTNVQKCTIFPLENL